MNVRREEELGLGMGAFRGRAKPHAINQSPMSRPQQERRASQVGTPGAFSCFHWDQPVEHGSTSIKRVRSSIIGEQTYNDWISKS